MKLVICEKPSVGAAVAAALGVREKKDGYIEGNGYVISWCIGHLVGLAEAAAYGEQYKKPQGKHPCEKGVLQLREWQLYFTGRRGHLRMPAAHFLFPAL